MSKQDSKPSKTKETPAQAPAPPADDEQIAALAKKLWEARGCPEGSPEVDWFTAEKLVRMKRKD
jgi:hypothetical protein